MAAFLWGPRNRVIAITNAAFFATAFTIFIIFYSAAVASVLHDTREATVRSVTEAAASVQDVIEDTERRSSAMMAALAISAPNAATQCPGQRSRPSLPALQSQLISASRGVRPLVAVRDACARFAWETAASPSTFQLGEGDDARGTYQAANYTLLSNRSIATVASSGGASVPPSIVSESGPTKPWPCNWSYDSAALPLVASCCTPTAAAPTSSTCGSVGVSPKVLSSLLHALARETSTIYFLLDGAKRVIASSLPTPIPSPVTAACPPAGRVAPGLCQATATSLPFEPLQRWASGVPTDFMNETLLVDTYAVTARTVKAPGIAGLAVVAFVEQRSVSLAAFRAGAIMAVLLVLIGVGAAACVYKPIDVLDRAARKAWSTAVRSYPYVGVDDASDEMSTVHDDDGGGGGDNDVAQEGMASTSDGLSPFRASSGTGDTPASDDPLAAGDERSETSSSAVISSVASSAIAKHRRRPTLAIGQWTSFVPKRLTARSLPTGFASPRCTAMCIRIVNYSALSASASSFAATLEAIYTAIDDGLAKYGGVLVSVQGESLHAVFSIDTSVDHTELRACISARWLIEAAAKQEWLSGAEGGVDVKLSIGMATGTVTVVNLGAGKLVNYMCTGAAADSATLLESANRTLGTTLIASKSTIAGCEEFVASRRLPTVRRVAKDAESPSIPIEAFEIVGPKLNTSMSQLDVPLHRALPPGCITSMEAAEGFASLATPRAQDVFVAAFHVALDLFEAAKFDGCLVKLQTIDPEFAQDWCVQSLKAECERRLRSGSRSPPPEHVSSKWMMDL